MTAYSKNNCTLKIDATTGATATTDYSTSIIKVTPKFPKQVGSTHTLNSGGPTTTTGGYDGSIDIELLAGSALATMLQAWQYSSDGDSRTVQLYTPDNTTGSDSWTGEFKLGGDLAPAMEGGSGDPATLSATLTLTGDITYAAVA